MTAFAAVMLWCAYLVRDALLLIYVSCLLALGFSPLVRLIERQRLLPIRSATSTVPRWLAILIPYVGLLAVIALVFAVIWPPLIAQASALWEQVPDMFDRGQRFLVGKGVLNEHLTLHEAIERAQGPGGAAAEKVAGAVIGLAGGIVGILTILILSLYILIDADNVRTSMLRLFPAEQRPRVAAVSREAMVKVSAWLGGQLLLAAVIGTTSAIGLWALGMPFFYVLALVCGIGELIPVFGPVLAAIPALAVAATISLQKTILVLIFLIVQQQLESNFLVPRIMSRQVGVSPVTVLVALLIGGSLLGIVGAILAVPTAAILQVLANQILNDTERMAEPVGGAPRR
jgi:predicted PurR-regulated permease PerM